MSGTFTPTMLAQGELPTTVAAIMAVPVGHAYYVKQVHLYNKNAATQTIKVSYYVGTVRRWRILVLAQDESADLLENGETLNLVAGNELRGETTTANAVDFTILGIDEV